MDHGVDQFNSQKNCRQLKRKKMLKMNISTSLKC